MRLNKMITALLDISRIEMGQLSIVCAPMDLSALGRRVVAEMQPTLELHTIEYSDPGVEMWVEGDELRLEQVLHNLISNAVKYSPAGGAVIVRLEQRGAYACAVIEDHGIGIPADAVPLLFTRFYRANNVDPQNISGMGIGLFVVKEIMTLHGELSRSPARKPGQHLHHSPPAGHSSAGTPAGCADASVIYRTRALGVFAFGRICSKPHHRVRV